MFKKSLGLTLIELLVVVSMIAALAGILLAVINQAKAKDRAQDGVRLTKIKIIAEAIESYRVLNRVYPQNSAALVPDYINEFPAGFVYVTNATATPPYTYFRISVSNSRNRYYVYTSIVAKVYDCSIADYSSTLCTSLSGL